MRKTWTIKEINFLKKNRDKYTSQELADKLGRTKASVGGACIRYNIHPTKPLKGFKKGNRPHNKGKKHNVNNHKTRFKKGNRPPNSWEDGQEGMAQDGGGKCFYYKPPGQSKRVKLSKWNWERVHGPIPAGHLIIHLDGNKTNCKVENLEIITRAENLKRNIQKINLSERQRTAWVSRRKESFVTQIISGKY